MPDLADNTAATTAGYTRTQTDRGATAVPRYLTRYTKPIIGDPDGGAGGILTAEAYATSAEGQAVADTRALAALNGQRNLRYGVTTGNKGKTGGVNHIHDLH